MKSPCVLIAGATMLLASMSASHAALLYYEGFDYGSTSGLLTTSSSGAWTTSSADNDAQYLSTGLSYGSLQTSGGKAQSVAAWGSGSRAVKLDFSNISLVGKNEVWVSMLLAVPGTVATNADASFGMEMTRNSWSAAQNYGAGKGYANTTGYMSNFLGNIPGAGFSSVGTNVILLVYRFTVGSAGELWLNPVLGGSTPTPGTGSMLTDGTNTGLTSINSLYINYRGQVLSMDEMRIGETFADVTPVPEPSTAVLAGVAVAAVCYGYRRKKSLPR